MCSGPMGMTGLFAFHTHSGVTPGVTKNQEAGSQEILQQIRGRHSPRVDSSSLKFESLPFNQCLVNSSPGSYL